MRVKKFRLELHGPFEDSGWIELSPTMNIFVGENNSGKSAILRSFLGQLPSAAHRSSKEWRSEYLGTSKHTVEVEHSGPELDWALRKTQSSGPTWSIGTSSFTTDQNVEAYLDQYLDTPKINHQITRSVNSDFAFVHTEPYKTNVHIFTIAIANGRYLITNSGLGRPTNTLHNILSWLWREKIFVFQGLRSSPAKMNYAPASRLDSNAINLAVELNGLQGDSPEMFSMLVSHLTSIFPTVGNLSVSAAEGTFEIRVWATPEQRNRELSFSLDDSGTGLAQAIAILFIAMTFESAVLVIDEISSYLHPSAAKALLRILQSNYPRHQYIISTHSPEVLTAGRDAKVFWVRKNGFISSIANVDLSNLDTLREVTGQLGVSMTDVFAAEHIIWVDGDTEEVCFPLLLEASGDRTKSVQFIAILHTGDFHDKKISAEKVFKIYERLTSATAPVISKVAFNFDSDNLTDAKKNELNTRSNGRIHFLPRKNFESYLLDPPAIARVIVEAFKEHDPLDVTEMEALTRSTLLQLAAESRYGTPADPVSYSDAGWLDRVDGARVIADLFSKITQQKLEYRKTTHSVALVRDLLQNSPGQLDGLIQYVRELVATARQ